MEKFSLHDAITNSDIENAVKKITVGLEKTNRVISDIYHPYHIL